MVSGLTGDVGAGVVDADAGQGPVVAVGELGGEGSAGGTDEYLAGGDGPWEAGLGGEVGVEAVRVDALAFAQGG